MALVQAACFLDMYEALIGSCDCTCESHSNVMQVQHPLDRGGDFFLLPIWKLVEPVACFASLVDAEDRLASCELRKSYLQRFLHLVLEPSSWFSL